MTNEHRGVHWNKVHNRWVVCFRVNGKAKNYGRFKDFDEAKKVAVEAYETLPTKTRTQKQCHKCGFVGSGVYLFPYYREGLCRTCVADNRKQKTYALLNRKCKTCKKPIGTKDKRQVVCSSECGHKGRAKEKTELMCSVCGKSVRRYADHLQKHKSVACSDTCQKIIAAKASAEIAKANKAKMKWHNERSVSRRKTSEAFKWNKRIAWWVRHPRIPVVDEWDKKLKSMISCNMHREAISKPQLKANQIKTRKSRRHSIWIDKWDEACSKMILLFNRKQMRERNKDPWANKLNNWQSNHKTRMRIKEHRSQLKDCDQS